MMAARTLAFSFEGLPHLPAAVVRRTRLVARTVARIDSATFALRGLGRVAVALEGVDLVPWDAEPPRPGDGCTFALVHAGAAAKLVFDPFLALALVRSVFGASAPAVARPLGRAERGMVGALVASALAAQGAGLAVGFDHADADGELVRLHLRVLAADIAGSAHVDVPVAWLGRADGPFAGSGASALETRLCVELARTTLERGAWAAAEAGDAVLFAGVSSPPAAGPWDCLLRVGPHVARGELFPDGRALRRGAFATIDEPPMKDTSIDSDSTAPDGAPLDPSVEAARVLAAAPVEVVAEVGRITVRGDEILGLCRGSVLALGPRRADIVSLRVGGVEWATGELVTIDDQLGVRITELRRRP
jgi:type III secretion system YscQ/HrcQ family protein